jgi:two-component system, NarL family, sensor histidine kinase DegS
MELRTLGDRRVVGFQALYAQAKQVLGNSANQLRALAATSRELSAEAVAGWHALRQELDALTAQNVSGDEVKRADLERAVAVSAAEIARQKSELGRLEVTVRTLESTWLFLEHGRDGEGDGGDPLRQPEIDMRILEAQETERTRLAQEIHDGPAQVLANAIFQIEYIDRILGEGGGKARAELRTLRDQLQHEMEEMRSYIHQLQNPLIGELGLNGAIREYAETLGRAAGLRIVLDLQAPEGALNEAEQTVVLRVIQEALRNVRRHAHASGASVATRIDGDGNEAGWLLEVRDDGEGFPVDATVLREGRRNFGLRFMRERADLIGAELSIDSRTAAGTTIRLRIARHGEPRHKGGES